MGINEGNIKGNKKLWFIIKTKDCEMWMDEWMNKLKIQFLETSELEKIS